MAVHYGIHWKDPDERLYDISIRFVAPCDDPRLILPSWRPGRYLMQNFAANVREWSPNLSKTAPSIWVAAARKGDEVVVRYRYWAGVLDAGSSFLDRDEAYFSGSNLFMWVDGCRDEEAALTIAAPSGWQIETQLPRDGGGVFRARSYDHLIDSPVIVAPSFTRHSFDEAGASVHLVFTGDDRVDTAQYIAPLRAIVRQQAAVFGELPVHDYRFLVHVADKWHGVEHEDSCSIVARRAALVGAGPGHEGYDHFLSICSHEFFHLWNVKRMLPAAFAPYDYTGPTPTRLLWAMEGMTSYYGDLTIARSGVWSVGRYLERLAQKITTLENMPARLHLPLSQASFDGWLQDPSRPHDRGNAWFSFYNKGEVVSALLDLTLRAGGSSLDDVVRALWRERVLDERAVQRAAGQDAFFERYVDGVEPLPYEDVLGKAGVEVKRTPRPASFGAVLKAGDGALVVDSAVAGGTAMAAGLLPGDEVVAIAGTRTRQPADVEVAVRSVREGEAVDVVYARDSLLRQRTVAIRSNGVTVELTPAEGRNEIRDGWLGAKNT